MTTKMTIWGTAGRIHADRQECQAYLREDAPARRARARLERPIHTELTEAVWFYLRGEEYSAQLDHFVDRVGDKELDGTNTFASAAVTDRVLELLIGRRGRTLHRGRQRAGHAPAPTKKTPPVAGSS